MDTFQTIVKDYKINNISQKNPFKIKELQNFLILKIEIRIRQIEKKLDYE